MRLTFVGGAREVTGANYLLESGDLRVLIDFGLAQGSRYNEAKNYEPLSYDVKNIDSVFVTHSHIDHIGRLPQLAKLGYRGPIYCSEPSAALAAVSLPDAFSKMVEESAILGLPALWDINDVEQAISQFHPVKYHDEIPLTDGVTVKGYNSGHVLGSTTWVFSKGETHISFPGDVGNPPSLLLPDIEHPPGVTHTLIESAYGNRLHEARNERRELLLDAVRETHSHGGTLVIPSFALERTQELLLEFDSMFEEGHLPRMPFFVDSPLAIRMTEVYGKFSSYFNDSAREILKNNGGVFNFPWLTKTISHIESKAINNIVGPKVIIAGSGMSQGGRIRHHEMRYLPDPHSAILFIGYQVKGSLGRRIRDHESSVKIFGHEVRVRCRVLSIGAYSAHADQNGLVNYLHEVKNLGALRECFVVQGELEAEQALSDRISKDLNISVHIPVVGESYEIA